MNIFEKRPLSLILCIMLGGFSLFLEAGSISQIVAIGISVLLFIATLLFKDLFGNKRIIVAIASLTFAISVALSIIFLNVFLPYQYYGTEVKIQGIVKEIDHTYSNSSRFTLETTKIDDTDNTYKIIVSGTKEELSGILAGDTISFTGMLEEFENSNNFDERSYYQSRGYSGSVYGVTDTKILSKDKNWSPGILVEWRDKICAKFKLGTNENTGNFLAALIMGDRDALDDNTVLNFSVIGITHILALSGMHLVILCEAIKRILSALRLSKKSIVVASTLFSLFYMALTGFSASVVRSAIMLTITNVLFLLCGTQDSYTTLPLSVVIILIFQPYAVYDLSLWLSAFATLGILVFSSLNNNKEECRNFIVSILLWLLDSILATVFALGATYMIVARYFTTFSLVAPITTLIFSTPINLLIYLGIILLVVDPFIPIGHLIVYLTDAIKEGVEVIASWQWATMSLDFPLVQALIVIFSVAFFSTIVFKIKRIKVAMSFVVILFFSSLVAGTIQTQIVRYTDESLYFAQDLSDTFLIKSEGETALIYSGNLTSYSARQDSNLIINNHLTQLDKLILTSYSDNAVDYIESFLGDIKTGTLYLPIPIGTHEASIAEAIADVLVTNGADLKFYEEEYPINIGDITYYLIARDVYEPYSAMQQVFTLNIEDEYYTYISGKATESLKEMTEIMAYASDYLIFGAYGGSSRSSSHPFHMMSEFVEGIYYVNSLPLSQNSIEYYKENEVPIKQIDTPLSLVAD